jgi:hypothetical protein
MRFAARAALVLAAAAAAAPRAQAFPAFARKYGMSCSACHVAWPILNQVGQAFRDNGYQFGRGKDDPATVTPGYVPVALRTTPAYEYTRTTNDPGLPRPMTLQHGGVPVPPGADILSGGAIATDISFLLVIAGFSPSDGSSAIESAWARLDNLGGSSWLNVKVGKFELDLPASPHRNPALGSGYAAYSALPQGSLLANPVTGSGAFDLGSNQVGIEIVGHDERSALRYALSFTSGSGGESLSNNAWSTPFVYLHVQEAFEFLSPVFPYLRVGALGGVGWWPTRFETDAGGQPVDGTGSAHKQFLRYGAEISWILGYPTTPAWFTVAYIRGQEAAGLAAGTDPYTGTDLSTVPNSFDSGFVELDWVPFSERNYDALPWLLFARADAVKFKRGVGSSQGATLGLRRYLAIGPRASAAIHLEGHWSRAKGLGYGLGPAQDGVIRDLTALGVTAGIDFDF